MKHIKMKSIIFLLSLVLIIAGVSGHIVQATDSSNQINDPFLTIAEQEDYYTNIDNIIASVGADVYQRMIDQEKALEAYNYFNSTILTDNEGNITYPECYAGEYIDGDTLVLLSTSDNDLAYYSDYLSDYSDTVSLLKVDYSLVELQTYANEIITILNSIESYSISPKENSIVFYTETGKLNNTIESYSQSLINKQTLSDINEQESHLLNIPVTFKEMVEVTLQATELYGGTKISNSAGPSFTLGFCGYYYGNSSIITSGHGQSTSNDLLYNSNIIGSFTLVQYSSGAYGDYSIASINSNGTTTSKVYGSSSKITITGSQTAPVGTLVFRYGAYSLGIEALEVDELNYTSTADDGISIKGITRCKHISGVYSTNGDSGGPIYLMSGTNAKAVGIHRGKSNTSGTDSYRELFTPMANVTGFFYLKTN